MTLLERCRELSGTQPIMVFLKENTSNPLFVGVAMQVIKQGIFFGKGILLFPGDAFDVVDEFGNNIIKFHVKVKEEFMED